MHRALSSKAPMPCIFTSSTSILYCFAGLKCPIGNKDDSRSSSLHPTRILTRSTGGLCISPTTVRCCGITISRHLTSCCWSLVGVKLSCAELYLLSWFERWHTKVRAASTTESIAKIALQTPPCHVSLIASDWLTYTIV